MLESTCPLTRARVHSGVGEYISTATPRYPRLSLSFHQVGAGVGEIAHVKFSPPVCVPEQGGMLTLFARIVAGLAISWTSAEYKRAAVSVNSTGRSCVQYANEGGEVPLAEGIWGINC